MKQTSIYENESLMDVCMRQYKNPLAIVAMCQANGLNLDSSEIVAGGSLSFDETLSFKKTSVLITKATTTKLKDVVLESQLLMDVCIQQYGSVEALVSLCVDNNISIDEDLQPGSVIKVKTDQVVRKTLISYLKQNKIKICTGDNASEDDDPNARLLEDGTTRELEDGTIRILE